jgi:hypothetical protein
MADTDAVTVTLDAEDGSDELRVPQGLLDVLAEEQDESAAEIVGDIAMLGLAQQIHARVAHGQEEPSEALEAVEEATLEQFEERFGRSFAEMTGHDH